MKLTSDELLAGVRFQAYLDTLGPKKRIRYLQAVMATLGDPQVIRFAPIDEVRVILEARSTWERIAPGLFMSALMGKTALANAASADPAATDAVSQTQETCR